MGFEPFTPHPYRLAVEARDGEAVAKALHPDAVFCPAPFKEPIRGRDNVLTFLSVLATVFENPEIIDELWGDGSYAFVARVNVEGHDIEVVDYLELDDEGLVKRVTTSARPLDSLQFVAERLADTHAELSTPEAGNR